MDNRTWKIRKSNRTERGTSEGQNEISRDCVDILGRLSGYRKYLDILFMF